MSIRVIEIVYSRTFGSFTDDKGVTTSAATRKAVAVALAYYAQSDGTRVFPSVPTIARDTELKDRAVQLAIKGMVAEGLLVVVKEGGKGQKSSTEYRWDLDRLAALPLAHPDRDRKGAPAAPFEMPEGASDAPLTADRVHLTTPKGACDAAKGASHAPDPLEIPVEDPDLSPPTPQARQRRARGARARDRSDLGSEADRLLAPLREKSEWADVVAHLIEPVVNTRKLLAPNPAVMVASVAAWAAEARLPVGVLQAAAHRVLEERRAAVGEDHIVAAVRAVQSEIGKPQVLDRPGARRVDADGKITITERSDPDAFAAWLAYHQERRRQKSAHEANLGELQRFFRERTLFPPPVTAPTQAAASHTVH